MSSIITDSVNQIEVIADRIAKAIATASDNPQKIDQLETLQKIISETLSTMGKQNKLVEEMLGLVNTKIKGIIATKNVEASDVQNICQAIHAIAEQVFREEKEPVLNQKLPPDLQGIALTYLSPQELKEQVEEGLAGNEFKADAKGIEKAYLKYIGDLLVKLPERKEEVERWQKDNVPLADQFAMLEIYELNKLPDDEIYAAIAAGIQEGQILTAKEKELANRQGISENAAIISKTLETIRKQLATVVTLDLRHKKLTYIPNAIKLLINLQDLDLSSNELTMVPDLSKNVKLFVLFLGQNRLTAIPDLSKNVKLHILNLRNNRLTVTPDLRKNIELTELNLENNQLTVAPDLSKNVKLGDLNLSDNKLNTAPDLRENLKLHNLALSNNQLTMAPDISNNVNMESLWLSKNQLTANPDLSKHVKLGILYLDYNQLTAPPDVSTNLHLTDLNLEHNQLTVAPDLSRNRNLGRLYLQNNQLKESPDLSKNPKISTFDIGQNNLSDIEIRKLREKYSNIRFLNT